MVRCAASITVSMPTWVTTSMVGKYREKARTTTR